MAAQRWHSCAGDPASIKAGLGSVPRAISTVAWYVKAAAAYRACKLRFPEQAGQDYQDALAEAHASLAPSLLRLCETNGGVYIKAAQLATTVSAVPQEYRGCAVASWCWLHQAVLAGHARIAKAVLGLSGSRNTHPIRKASVASLGQDLI